jgi:hypothetical protein
MATVFMYIEAVSSIHSGRTDHAVVTGGQLNIAQDPVLNDTCVSFILKVCWLPSKNININEWHHSCGNFFVPEFNENCSVHF